ncbi:hypothetical protein [Paraflavitalea speifideaquila]|uniref:hypothetical protein n=1 Tax=Paraflavitalea speifideaquila TaxID=3076558 RepID=UPI0028E9574E|nr:hypothetical protein [Paraflavitalea speifideiaquila]
MKFVGILKEHESGLVKIGQALSDFNAPNKSKIENYEAIVSYLENGTIVISFLHYVQDAMGNSIVPLIFYTDGKWIWPSYLVHYLSKNYTSLLPVEFIADMKYNKFDPQKSRRRENSGGAKVL